MAKTAPAPEEVAPEDVPVATGAKKKKMIIIMLATLLILGIAGGGAAFFMSGKKDSGKKEAKKTAEKSPPAVYLAMDNFVVNLQSSEAEKYLQIGVTLQVKNEEQLNFYKSNMPQLRSRLLLLLSSKSASDLSTNDGKVKLSNEIIKQAQLPFNKDEVSPKEMEERRILGVFFTSFMIQ